MGKLFKHKDFFSHLGKIWYCCHCIKILKKICLQDVHDKPGTVERVDGDGQRAEDCGEGGERAPHPRARLCLPAALRHGRALLRGVLLPVPWRHELRVTTVHTFLVLKAVLRSFFAHYFLKVPVHLHHFSKIKSHKVVTKQKESVIFLLSLLDDRRIRIHI